ncbi:MAG TPA: DEAD/DEAH box helicase [Thiolinea sp.]|nr:DEAD/DEAH box helicase [Thiolinea sp.]
MSFSDLGLQEAFAASIASAGYENPTELQQQLIPLMAQQKSVLVWSQSAAGKTGAFLIPAINHILNHPLEEHQGTRILILTSRRDRVNQITYTVKRLLGDEQQLRTGFIVSGRPYQPQMRLLRRPLDLMIATPGRMNDLVDNNKADFSRLELLIIDDLTTICKKGLSQLVDKIVAQKPASAPVVAFVRHDDEVTPYARQLLPEAEEVTIEDEKTQLLHLKQVVHLADDFTHKLALSDYLLESLQGKPVVIFANTSKTAKLLADSLANHGHAADSTHLLAPEERNLEDCPILIVPDQEEFLPEMAGNEVILHFEMPDKPESYINRMQDILGFAERSEQVYLLIGGQDREALKKLEEFQGEALPQRTIPGLEPTQSHRPGKVGAKGGARKTSARSAAGNKGAARSQRKGNSQGQQQDGQQPRARKGPYGRLNGGANRKLATQRSEAPYEIGSWEKDDYKPQKAASGDKKVVIRYKEKKRRVLVK